MTTTHARIRWALPLIGILCLGAPAPSGAQVEVSGQVAAEAFTSFYVDPICFAGQTGTQSRVDIFVYVGYEALSFVKQGDLYSASYEMTMSILDSSNSLVSEKLWTEEINGVPFDRSVSPSAYSLTQRIFTLSPGTYQVRVNIRDLETKMSRQITRRITVRDFATPDFSESDLMLLSRVVVQGEKRSIVPNVSPNLGMIPDQFHMYFEVYNRRGIDSVRFHTEILDKNGETVLTVDTLSAVGPGRNERILRVPHASVPLGDYQVRVQTYRTPSHTTMQDPIASSARPFIIRWMGVPRSVKDIDLAIEQLRYIAKDEELSKLREPATPEEKQTKFFEFWKKRDPNPNTPRNEKMEEFYARVEYANRHFAHYLEGWKTDMGMIYIIFGPPSNVDRHPFDVDSKPYEVWSYYDLNYSFVFVDQTGFGDYRLETPLWEIWNRPRQ